MDDPSCGSFSFKPMLYLFQLFTFKTTTLLYSCLSRKIQPSLNTSIISFFSQTKREQIAISKILERLRSRAIIHFNQIVIAVLLAIVSKKSIQNRLITYISFSWPELENYSEKTNFDWRSKCY